MNTATFQTEISWLCTYKLFPAFWRTLILELPSVFILSSYNGSDFFFFVVLEVVLGG